MTFEQATDYILSVFKTAWDTTGNPAVYDDVGGKPPSTKTTWARATVQHATGGQAALSGEVGTKKFGRTGAVIVQIFSPQGDGKNAGLVAAQVVVNAFQDSRHSNIWFRNVRMNEVGSSGAFSQLNVLATFNYEDMR